MKLLYFLVGSALTATFATAQHKGWTVYSSRPQALASSTASSGSRIGSSGYSGGRTSGTSGSSFGHK